MHRLARRSYLTAVSWLVGSPASAFRDDGSVEPKTRGGLQVAREIYRRAGPPFVSYRVRPAARQTSATRSRPRLRWQRDGAEWVHLVDLDAAFGRGDNRELLAGLVRRLDIAVELSGGIRDDDSLTAALATGAARVNLGTAALESPDWVRSAIARYGDADRGRLRCARHDARRTRRPGGGDIWETMARLDVDGCARYVVTDINKDGTLAGPNLQLLREACTRPTPRWSPAGECPRWMTCAPSPASALRTAVAWRERLSARPSTPGPSPCPRRWR